MGPECHPGATSIHPGMGGTLTDAARPTGSQRLESLKAERSSEISKRLAQRLSGILGNKLGARVVTLIMCRLSLELVGCVLRVFWSVGGIA